MQEPVKPVAKAKPASAKRSARFSPKIAVKGPVLALLALVIILGSTLRFVGIGWSLPDARHPVATYHPDEAVDFKALQFVDIFAGQFDIGFYNYGTLYFYLSDFAQTIGHGYGAIPNTPSLPAGSRHLPRMEEAARNLPETRGIYLSARILTALMGVLTIPVLFALGRRLYGDIVGLWAALFYAIMPLAVVHAHFFTVDVGATLFVALALLASAKLLKKQTWREYLIAGIWTGLAAATKYSVGIVICAPIVAHLMASKPDARWSPRALPLLFGATLVAFLIGCPGPLLNWNVFWNGLPNYPNSGVAYELLQHPRQGHGLLFVELVQRDIVLFLLAFVPLGIVIGLADQRYAAHQRRWVIRSRRALGKRVMRRRLVVQHHFVVALVAKGNHGARAAHNAIVYQRLHRAEPVFLKILGCFGIRVEHRFGIHLRLYRLVPAVGPRFGGGINRRPAKAAASRESRPWRLGHTVGAVSVNQARVNVFAFQIHHHIALWHSQPRANGFNYAVLHQQGAVGNGLARAGHNSGVDKRILPRPHIVRAVNRESLLPRAKPRKKQQAAKK